MKLPGGKKHSAKGTEFFGDKNFIIIKSSICLSNKV